MLTKPYILAQLTKNILTYLETDNPTPGSEILNTCYLPPTCYVRYLEAIDTALWVELDSLFLFLAHVGKNQDLM